MANPIHENGPERVAGGCEGASALTCSFRFEPITLKTALGRFHSEAEAGVCDTGRYRCPYYLWGNGPTLVCVPGLVDDAKSFLLLLACLSLRFRCVAYDWPRGNGDEVSLARYRHEDFVHDFFAVLDQVGAQEVLPLGYSFGSTIVLKALQAQPNRFRRAVLLSGFAQRRLAPAERLLAMMARYWPGPLRNLPLRKWVLQSHHAHVFNCRGNDVWKYYLQRSGAMPMAALARRALVMDRLDLRDLLPRIQQDILLVCGDGDPLVSKKCETELLTGLRNSARVELANCGHLSIYTHPELLAEVVGEYFGGC